MGFKSKARKSVPPMLLPVELLRTRKRNLRPSPVYVAGCDNFADKKIGGRRLAFDRAADVWGEDGIEGQSRRISVCKSCYREWKKAKKDDMDEWS